MRLIQQLLADMRLSRGSVLIMMVRVKHIKLCKDCAKVYSSFQQTMICIGTNTLPVEMTVLVPIDLVSWCRLHTGVMF